LHAPLFAQPRSNVEVLNDEQRERRTGGERSDDQT